MNSHQTSTRHDRSRCQRSQHLRRSDRAFRARAHARRRSSFCAASTTSSTRLALRLLAARAERHRRLQRGERLDFLSDTESVRKGDWRVASAPRGPRRPASRDHWPRRSKDDDQRAQFGSECLHGGPRGRAVADLGERRRGTGEPHGRGAADPVARLARGKALRAQRANGDAGRSATRMAPGRVPRIDRRRSDVGEPVRFRPVLLSQRARARRARNGPVFLPPEDREPSRDSPLERRVSLRAGRARHPAGDDPRDRAHRNDLRRLRDGGDPLRAARSRRRAERRADGTICSASSRRSARARAACCPTARSSR